MLLAETSLVERMRAKWRKKRMRRLKRKRRKMRARCSNQAFVSPDSLILRSK